MNVQNMVLAISLALAGCGGGSVSTQSPAQVSHPTPPVVQAAPRSNVVAFMGDSITARWATMPTVPGAVEMNLGVVGNVTAQMWGRFQAEVIDADVGVVVILGGTNDIIAGFDGTTIDNIATMAKMATDAGIRVILCTVPPDTQATMDSAEAGSQAAVYSKEEALNDALIDLAAKNGYLVADYHDALVLPDGTQDTSLFVDGEHPDAAGYARMWPVILPLIQEALR